MLRNISPFKYEIIAFRTGATVGNQVLGSVRVCYVLCVYVWVYEPYENKIMH